MAVAGTIGKIMQLVNPKWGVTQDLVENLYGGAKSMYGGIKALTNNWDDLPSFNTDWITQGANWIHNEIDNIPNANDIVNTQVLPYLNLYPEDTSM